MDRIVFFKLKYYAESKKPESVSLNQNKSQQRITTKFNSSFPQAVFCLCRYKLNWNNVDNELLLVLLLNIIYAKLQIGWDAKDCSRHIGSMKDSAKMSAWMADKRSNKVRGLWGMWNVSWGTQRNEIRRRQSKVAWGTDGKARILTLTL